MDAVMQIALLPLFLILGAVMLWRLNPLRDDYEEVEHAQRDYR